MVQMLARAWRGFRSWRRTRPFWAGVFGILAAIAIFGPPVLSVNIGDVMLTIATLGGVSSIVLSTVIACCAVALWVRPQVRIPCGVLIMVASLTSLVTANFGGFGIGLLLGLLSATLALSWAPGRLSAIQDRGDADTTGPGQAPASAKQTGTGLSRAA
ncbi:DUF6114 domain-containing protein [Haloechinothrix sp. LS1_15]|uniref:DUF6114 domain-containing protein n=1 Tax=Haloechinothrix sp. LS1_15 TaxID=2652248 RepID=UPI002947509F|nr:DUF6114 domain-containing protein [Haloechinothrix sp. LS1_15]MDV6012363.1 hypothetical protein [Haloechinothrix sp. LS1_15]